MFFPGTVVFIPGLLCDHRLWHAQEAALQGRCATMVGDTLQDDSIAAMAARIVAAAPDKFALCGLSMGGYVAMEIMRIAPERVTHLVLSDTTARQDSAEQRQRRLDFIKLAGQGRFVGVTRRLLPQLIAPQSLDQPHIADTVMAMAETLGREVYLRQQTAIMARIDSRESLARIACPAAIIVGEQDTMTPLALAKEMAELIPGAQMHVIPKAGHLPPLEQPEAFNHFLTLSLMGEAIS